MHFKKMIQNKITKWDNSRFMGTKKYLSKKKMKQNKNEVRNTGI